ncbi:MAG: hypothetical protein BalsKO_21710 [Balneolaceae bacterium]
MRKNYLWYNLFRLGITKTGLYFFYSKIEIIGQKNIPKNKPFILLPNHQNSFMDALLVCTHVPGYIFFLTRAGAFSTKFMNWFLRSLNMLPVYRVRDGLSSVTKNNEIFDFCVRSLEKRHPILVFPEANHDLRRRIRPLSKGFTRIAFDAEVQNNWQLDLQILPVGVNYSEHRRSRNRVSVVIEEPIPMQKYKELFEADERKAANSLKNEAAAAMKKTVMHVPNLDHYPLHQIVLTDLENDTRTYIQPEIANENVAKIDAHITSELAETARQVLEISNKYDISIKTIHGRKKPLIYLILLFPFYIFSWFNNIIPYLPVRKVINEKIKDHAFDASIKFLLGLILFPLFWWIIAGVLWISGVPNVYVLGYLVLSVFTSVFFKNSNLFLRGASMRARYKKMKETRPEDYKTFSKGLEILNEFRLKVLKE